MNELILLHPSKSLKNQIIDYKQEYLNREESNINGSCGLIRHNNINEWIRSAQLFIQEELRNNVHVSTFFSIRKSDNRIIGTVQLRHSLTNELRVHGGHIGYSIRPTERKKGYGIEQLLLVLEVAREMKIPKVLIVCDKENIASAKIIKACGGILTDENVYNGIEQQLYWIKLY